MPMIKNQVFIPSGFGSRNRGFTLIEVLIAVIVMSIGLLGLAGLQTAGMRNNHTAYLRSQATVLAYDIVDRMRATRSRTVANLGQLTSYAIAIGTSASGSTDCSVNFCSSAQMANYDLVQWKAALNQALPLGDGSVTVNVNGSIVTVTIAVQWDEDRDGVLDPPFQVQTQL